jgi:tetratricopeptide (TPR) repeat protein
VARKHSRNDAPETMLEEVASLGERLVAWVAANAVPVGAVVVASLIGIGTYGVYQNLHKAREARAADALEQVRSDYLKAMGADPGAIDVPELANPKAQRQINEEYAVRFREVAADHEGTVAGVLAALELGNVLAATGDLESPLETWNTALAELPRGSSLRGVLLQRMAQAHEDAGRWSAAAARHEQAGGVKSFPLRYWSLADAARCYLAAGERERARVLFDQVAREAPDLRLPAHIRVLMREVQTDQSG